jgi:predicted acetyltransferase
VIELRTMTDADLPALRHVDGWAFGKPPSDERWAVSSAVLERERQTGAFCADELVGHTAAFTQVLTVPGGSIPAAGVTWVGVSPTHRRRGVASGLMTHQLDALRADGEAVATLWASEPGIYGRFGYGIASRRAGVTVPRPAWLRGGEPGGWSVRLGDAADAIEECAVVYEHARTQLSGMVTRSAQAWREGVFDEPGSAGSSSPLRYALALDETGQAGGYVWFRTAPHWEAGNPDGTVEVFEIVTTSPGSTRALLDVVLDLDLMTRTRFWNLPIDHPLLTWTQHSHRLRPRIDEQLWVRLVRLDEALAARTYSAQVDVVLAVHDEVCPWNAGRWRLSAGADGCVMARSHDAADLSLDVSDLAGAYLGDDVLNRALVAGGIGEHTPGAGRALARAMRADRAPWCAYMF